MNRFPSLCLTISLIFGHALVQANDAPRANEMVSVRIGNASADAENREATVQEEASIKQAVETGCKGKAADRFLNCVALVAQHLPPIDPARRAHFGERYNPKEWAACMKRGFERQGMYGTGGCDAYRLRRLENPEYWPNPKAPPFKWPDDPKESVYRPGMSSKDYFDALCTAEAGEFFYKPAEHAEGIYQIRPRAMEDDNDRQEDRFVLEDPFGYRYSESHDPYFRRLSAPLKLTYFETPSVKVAPDHYLSLRQNRHPSFADKPGDEVTVFRYVGYDSKDLKSVRREFDTRIESRYGYVWRGIDRPNDRMHGIGGGEIAVVELATNQIIALKRGFVFSGAARTKTGIRWETARLCPADQQEISNFVDNFLKRAIKP